MIHPTAIIHPRAHLDPSVDVGPYAVIEEGVEVGPGCRIGAYVHMSGLTRIGTDNVFHPGAVIGNIPQDLKYRGAPSRTVIGDRNSFREHVTINRATDDTEDTVIGSDNLLMAGAHVAHNTHVGNQCIIANGVLLGGHVEIQDRAVISGTCLVHQFVRVGTFAMMQGGSGISKDLPPFTMARGDNAICGLNVVGLRRAGISGEERLELQRLYRFLFRGTLGLRAAVEKAREEFKGSLSVKLLEFVAASKRGIPADVSRGSRRGRRDAEEESAEADE
jgi:UDP-N-acetylglucosamine acyltransferase